MGTDIWTSLEVRDPSRFGDEKWHVADSGRLEPECGPIWIDRNYELFGFLADVRNEGGNPSFGFNRGIPADADEKTLMMINALGLVPHDFGYATLSELLEKISTVDKVKRRGFVHKDLVKWFKETGDPPGCWRQKSRWPCPKDHEYLEWEVEPHCFDQLIEVLEDSKRILFHIPSPEEDDHSMDGNIRIVFWFDS